MTEPRECPRIDVGVTCDEPICPQCNGDGIIETLLFNGNPQFSDCTECGGAGWVGTND